MKTLIKLSLCLLILSLTSCLERGSQLKSELGIVVAKQYSPEVNQNVFGMVYDHFDQTWKYQNHNIHEDTKFCVVFKCEHQIVFTINDANIYAKVNEKDTVKIYYYEMLNKKGEVKDFDFIDANKIN